MTKPIHSADAEDTKLQNKQEQQKLDEEKDLQRIRNIMEARKSRRHKATWVEASLQIPSRPPIRYPVIIGDNSMFKTADDVRAFLGLSDSPPVRLVPQVGDDWESPVPSADHSYPVCEINMMEINRLKKLAECERVLVWFHGMLRSAFLPGTRKVSEE